MIILIIISIFFYTKQKKLLPSLIRCQVSKGEVVRSNKAASRKKLYIFPLSTTSLFLCSLSLTFYHPRFSLFSFIPLCRSPPLTFDTSKCSICINLYLSFLLSLPLSSVQRFYLWTSQYLLYVRRPARIHPCTTYFRQTNK